MQWRYPNQHRCSFSVSLFAAQLIGILHWEYFLRATTISGHISDDPASLLLATADCRKIKADSNKSVTLFVTRWKVTYELQALVSGNGEIFDYIGWRVKTGRKNVFQSRGINHRG